MPVPGAQEAGKLHFLRTLTLGPRCPAVRKPKQPCAETHREKQCGVRWVSAGATLGGVAGKVSQLRGCGLPSPAPPGPAPTVDSGATKFWFCFFTAKNNQNTAHHKHGIMVHPGLSPSSHILSNKTNFLRQSQAYHITPALMELSITLTSKEVKSKEKNGVGS